MVASRIINKILGAESRPKPIQEAAEPLGGLAMSAGVVVGLIIALGTISPSALEQLPRDAIAIVPKLLSAAIIVILANVLSNGANG